MKYSKQAFEKAKKQLTKKGPEYRALLKRHKVEFKPKPLRDPFESLVRAIAHQQLHGKAAETILNRMLALFPDKKFPSAEDILTKAPEDLRACGFSASKVRSILDIADKTSSGVVPTAKEIRKLSNQEIIDRLTTIFGVGKWTVEMLLIFQLGRLNIWPVDDFGVRKGFQLWQKKRKFPSPKDLRPIGAHFEPYQTVMALYLWREADLAKVKKEK